MAKSSVRKDAKTAKPYDTTKRSQTRASKPTATRTRSPPPPPPSSSSPLPGPSPVVFRQLCLEKIPERYPGLKPRSDWDIMQLAGTEQRTGTHAEVYAWLDAELAANLEAFGEEETNANVRAMLDAVVQPTGSKPPPGTSSDLIFVRSISDSQYSIRLYPGSYADAQYCLDFVDTETGEPVNSPFDYELWATPNPETPWLSMPVSGKLRSIERAHGIKQEDILPGREKFILMDGQTCVLIRPGKKTVRFTVPVRKHGPDVDVNDSIQVLDLPKVIRS